MKFMLAYLLVTELTVVVAFADDFAKAEELKDAAVSSFRFVDDAPHEDKVGASKSKDTSKSADRPNRDSQMVKADLGGVVALDPFEVITDKIPVVTRRSESPLAKYVESGALYAHAGKKVTTRIVLSPTTGFGISFSW